MNNKHKNLPELFNNIANNIRRKNGETELLFEETEIVHNQEWWGEGNKYSNMPNIQIDEIYVVECDGTKYFCTGYGGYFGNPSIGNEYLNYLDENGEPYMDIPEDIHIEDVPFFFTTEIGSYDIGGSAVYEGPEWTNSWVCFGDNKTHNLSVEKLITDFQTISPHDFPERIRNIYSGIKAPDEYCDKIQLNINYEILTPRMSGMDEYEYIKFSGYRCNDYGYIEYFEEKITLPIEGNITGDKTYYLPHGASLIIYISGSHFPYIEDVSQDSHYFKEYYNDNVGEASLTLYTGSLSTGGYNMNVMVHSLNIQCGLNGVGGGSIA